MGYTHYWRRPEELPADLFAAFAADARKIVAATTVLLTGWHDGDTTITPAITDMSVGFNGVGDESHETFLIETNIQKSKWDDVDLIFDFCKTAAKPYDEVVTAVLIAAKKHFGSQIVVTSDGDDSDWEAGRLLCQHACGYGTAFHFADGDRGEGLHDLAQSAVDIV